MAVDPAKLRGIDPRQEPISSLDRLAAVVGDAFTIAVKLLDPKWTFTHRDRGPFSGRHLAELRGAEAEAIRVAVAGLEPGRRVRCHRPRYSLVMWSPDRPVAEVAICFHCRNMSTRLGTVPGWLTFDASAPAGEELLALCKSYDHGAPPRPESGPPRP